MHRFYRMMALGVGFTLTVASAAMAEPKVLAGVAYEEVVRGKPAEGAVIPLLVAFHYSGGSAAESFAHYDELPGPVRILVPLGAFPKRQGLSYFPVDYSQRPAAERYRIAHDTAAQMAEFVRAATREYGARPVVSGISQGGDLSLLLAIHHPDLIKASFPFAPVIPPELIVSDARAKAEGPPIHVMQGDADAIIDVALTRTRVAELAEDLPIRLTTYPGLGHDISTEMEAGYSPLINAALRGN
jgi:phospholipase/carboxylesterase